MTFFKWLIVQCFRCSGWKIQGQMPPGVKKAVFVGAPHTSNWDLFNTLGLMFSLNLPFRFLIKREALVFPIKGFLLRLGAYPVQRSQGGSHLVEQIARVFDEGDECFLCIAPEGTRKPVKKWKTGFYHIAKAAGVPIVVGYLDCQQKVVSIGHQLDPSLSEAETMGALREILKKAVARNPGHFQLPELEESKK